MFAVAAMAVWKIDSNWSWLWRSYGDQNHRQHVYPIFIGVQCFHFECHQCLAGRDCLLLEGQRSLWDWGDKNLRSKCALFWACHGCNSFLHCWGLSPTLRSRHCIITCQTSLERVSCRVQAHPPRQSQCQHSHPQCQAPRRNLGDSWLHGFDQHVGPIPTAPLTWKLEQLLDLADEERGEICLLHVWLFTSAELMS